MMKFNELMDCFYDWLDEYGFPPIEVYTVRYRDYLKLLDHNNYLKRELTASIDINSLLKARIEESHHTNMSLLAERDKLIKDNEGLKQQNEDLRYVNKQLSLELEQRRQEVSKYGSLKDRIQELEDEVSASKDDYEKLYDRYVSLTMENGRLRRQLDHAELK